MNITSKIQALRKEKGWTITKLSAETNIPTVSLRVMLSREDPNGYTVKNLIKIAEALGVTVSFLTLEDDEKECPTLTYGQREEIKSLISSTIDEYFSLSTPIEEKQEEITNNIVQRKATVNDLED